MALFSERCLQGFVLGTGVAPFAVAETEDDMELYALYNARKSALRCQMGLRRFDTPCDEEQLLLRGRAEDALATMQDAKDAPFLRAASLAALGAFVEAIEALFGVPTHLLLRLFYVECERDGCKHRLVGQKIGRTFAFSSDPRCYGCMTPLRLDEKVTQTLSTCIAHDAMTKLYGQCFCHDKKSETGFWMLFDAALATRNIKLRQSFLQTICYGVGSVSHFLLGSTLFELACFEDDPTKFLGLAEAYFRLDGSRASLYMMQKCLWVKLNGRPERPIGVASLIEFSLAKKTTHCWSRRAPLPRHTFCFSCKLWDAEPRGRLWEECHICCIQKHTSCPASVGCYSTARLSHRDCNERWKVSVTQAVEQILQKWGIDRRISGSICSYVWSDT
jgi:hypothetical protein